MWFATPPRTWRRMNGPPELNHCRIAASPQKRVSKRATGAIWRSIRVKPAPAREASAAAKALAAGHGTRGVDSRRKDSRVRSAQWMFLPRGELPSNLRNPAQGCQARWPAASIDGGRSGWLASALRHHDRARRRRDVQNRGEHNRAAAPVSRRHRPRRRQARVVSGLNSARIAKAFRFVSAEHTTAAGSCSTRRRWREAARRHVSRVSPADQRTRRVRCHKTSTRFD